MKHDHSQFAAIAQAYADPPVVEDRIHRFMPMVRKAAWHIHSGTGGGPDLDDLVQTGTLALLECARRHAGPTEDGFAAYAKLRVRGAMIDAVRKAVPGSRGSAARRRAAEADGEVADAPVQLTSLEDSYDDRSGHFADERPDSFALLSEAEDAERLGAAIGALPERLQLILQLYFLEELNLSEIAAVLEVSIPRVHQLKAQALSQVRAMLEKG